MNLTNISNYLSKCNFVWRTINRSWIHFWRAHQNENTEQYSLTWEFKLNAFNIYEYINLSLYAVGYSIKELQYFLTIGFF